MRENQPFPNSVPQGRLNLAQDASPGLDLKGRPSPVGTAENRPRRILDNLQASLRDSIMLHDVPKTDRLAGIYDYRLVTLSVLISTLASFAALDPLQLDSRLTG